MNLFRVNVFFLFTKPPEKRRLCHDTRNRITSKSDNFFFRQSKNFSPHFIRELSTKKMEEQIDGMKKWLDNGQVLLQKLQLQCLTRQIFDHESSAADAAASESSAQSSSQSSLKFLQSEVQSLRTQLAEEREIRAETLRRLHISEFQSTSRNDEITKLRKELDQLKEKTHKSAFIGQTGESNAYTFLSHYLSVLTCPESNMHNTSKHAHQGDMQFEIQKVTFMIDTKEIKHNPNQLVTYLKNQEVDKFWRDVDEHHWDVAILFCSQQIQLNRDGNVLEVADKIDIVSPSAAANVSFSQRKGFVNLNCHFEPSENLQFNLFFFSFELFKRTMLIYVSNNDYVALLRSIHHAFCVKYFEKYKLAREEQELLLRQQKRTIPTLTVRERALQDIALNSWIPIFSCNHQFFKSLFKLLDQYKTEYTKKWYLLQKNAQRLRELDIVETRKLLSTTASAVSAVASETNAQEEILNHDLIQLLSEMKPPYRHQIPKQHEEEEEEPEKIQSKTTTRKRKLKTV
jgi:hypothetical protein